MKEKNSLLFSLSETPKKENEDFHTTFENQSFSGVIVADGVGSYSRAKDTSRFAVDLLEKEILKLNCETLAGHTTTKHKTIKAHVKARTVTFRIR